MGECLAVRDSGDGGPVQAVAGGLNMLKVSLNGLVNVTSNTVSGSLRDFPEQYFNRVSFLI